MRPVMEGYVGRLVGDRERSSLLEGHGFGDRKDARFRHADHLRVSATRERGRRDDALAGPRPFARLADRTRDLAPWREREVGPLLVLAPAQEDVEKVERRRLDLDHDLVGLGYRLFHPGQLERLFRVPESLHLPRSHAGSSPQPALPASRLPQRRSVQDAKLLRETGWPPYTAGGK